MYSITEKYYELLKDEYPNRNDYITFRYMLPFRMPFRAETHFEVNGVVFTFLNRTYKQFAKNDLVFDDVLIRHTIVEATLPLTQKKSSNMIKGMTKRKSTPAKEVSDVFDYQFDILNDYCQVLLVMYKLYNIIDFSFSDIVGIPTYSIYEVKDDNFKGKLAGEFRVKNNKRIEENNKLILSTDKALSAKDTYHKFKNNPYYMHSVYGRKGEREYYKENFNQSIINFQTSMEIFVQQFIVDCYTKMNWKPAHKINNLKKRKEFTKHVDDHLIKLFGKLNFKNEKLLIKLVTKYKDYCFQYRNNIVHEGKHYGRVEARMTKTLISDITNLILYDVRNAPSNSFTTYYKNLYSNASNNNIEDLVGRYGNDVKI